PNGRNNRPNRCRARSGLRPRRPMPHLPVRQTPRRRRAPPPLWSISGRLSLPFLRDVVPPTETIAPPIAERARCFRIGLSVNGQAAQFAPVEKRCSPQRHKEHKVHFVCFVSLWL